MNTVLRTIDFASLSPLLILLAAALVLLLLEAFADKAAKKCSFYVTIFSLLLALVAAITAPSSDNSLLTPWFRFDSLALFLLCCFWALGLLRHF